MFLTSSKKFEVVTIGSAIRDMIFFTQKGKILKTPEDITSQRLWTFEYGAKVEIDSFFNSLGGGALNTAYNFHKLEVKVAPFVHLGNDIDGEWVKKIAEHGISNLLVQIDEKEKTGISLIMCSQKKEPDHIIFVHRGANNNLEITESMLSRIETNWFLITSLSGNNWMQTLKNIFDYAHKKNIRIAWNPGGRQLGVGKKRLAPFLRVTDVLILNKDEAIELVLSGIKVGRRDPKFLNKPVYLLNILSEWGPHMVVITPGKKGACALKGDKMYRRGIIDNKVVDTTGVGDAFSAAFISGLIHENMNVAKALAWGVFQSSFVVTKPGAHGGVMSKKELLDVMMKYYRPLAK